MDHENKLKIGYNMNQYLNYLTGNYTKWYGNKLTRFKKPGEVFGFWDGSRGASYYLYINRELTDSPDSGHPGSVMLRHKDGANAAFIDGHAEFISRQAFIGLTNRTDDNILRWQWTLNEQYRPYN